MNGAEVDKLFILNAEITAARQQHKTSYFTCLSYDVLFGVMIGIIGVAVAVCLSTFVLLWSDVVTPLWQAGRDSWSGGGGVGLTDSKLSADHDSSPAACFKCGVGMWAPNGRSGPDRTCRLGLVIDITLRLLGSTLVGVGVSTLVVYVSWHYLNYDETC